MARIRDLLPAARHSRVLAAARSAGEIARHLLGRRNGDSRRAEARRFTQAARHRSRECRFREVFRRNPSGRHPADWVPGRIGARRRPPRFREGPAGYPIGKVLFETAGWIQDPRFSADGKRIAFIDHPRSDDGGGSPSSISPARRPTSPPGLRPFRGSRGRRTAVRSGLRPPATGSGGGSSRSPLPASSGSSGPCRVHRRCSTWRFGRLVTEDDYRSGTLAFLPGQPRAEGPGLVRLDERPGALDRRQVLLFDETGEGGGPNGSVYLRPTDGSAAVRLSEGTGLALSPDGAYAMTRTATEPSALRPRSGESGAAARVSARPFGSVIYGAFFPDGNRFVFEANAPGRGARLYVQAVSGGAATPISSEGINYSPSSFPRTRAGLRRWGPIEEFTFTRRRAAPRRSSRRPGPATFSPDGRPTAMASMSHPGRGLRASRRRLRTPDAHPRPGNDTARMFSRGFGRITPDGQTMTLGFHRVLDAVLDPKPKMTLSTGTRLGPYEILAPSQHRRGPSSIASGRAIRGR